MAEVKVWMPLFIGDYLAETSRLTTEQHGAYMLLIMDYWRNGPPPDDPQVLAQIARLTLDAWSNAQAMLKHIFSIEDGVWRHKRIDAELLAAKENHGKAQVKAKAAADARWGKSAKNAPSNAPSNAQAMLEECPSPSPSPIPITSKTKSKAKATPPASLAMLSEVDPQVAADFVAIRAKQKAPITQTAIDGIAREAGKAGLTLEGALRICCERSWRGFKAEWVTPDAIRGSPLPPRAGRATAAMGTNAVEFDDPFAQGAKA
jgi:uncharacterized protein YdaU (DUF1376 family)